MGNNLVCKDCKTIEKEKTIQSLGISTRDFQTGLERQEKDEFIYYLKSEKEFEEEKEKWSIIQNTTSNLIRPTEIEIIEKVNLFAKQNGLKITFEIYRLSLRKFIEDNEKTSGLIPEVQIFNLLAIVFEVLWELYHLKIDHGNITSEGIFLTPAGDWTVITPNSKYASVLKASQKMRIDFRYLVYSEKNTNYTQIQKDLFSLGITVLDVIRPFSETEKQSNIDKLLIVKKLKFVKQYYSRNLGDFLGLITGAESSGLPDVFEVKNMLDVLRDL